MAELICRKHDYSEKIEYVPNWSDDFQKGEKHDVPMMPTGFNLVMAGTINGGLGIDDLEEFLKIVNSHKDINVVFIGGGARKDTLEKFVKKNSLTTSLPETTQIFPKPYTTYSYWQ